MRAALLEQLEAWGGRVPPRSVELSVSSTKNLCVSLREDTSGSAPMNGHACSLGHLATNTALRSQNDPFAGHVSFLWLLSQITTNLVASNHRH